MIRDKLYAEAMILAILSLALATFAMDMGSFIGAYALIMVSLYALCGVRDLV